MSTSFLLITFYLIRFAIDFHIPATLSILSEHANLTAELEN